MATEPFAAAREAFESGASLRRIQRRFHMTDSEMRDALPEEFPDEGPLPEGNCGY